MKSVLQISTTQIDHLVTKETGTVVRIATPRNAKVMKVLLERQTGLWKVQYAFPFGQDIEGLTFKETTLDKFVEDGWIVIAEVE
ncbi:hypothetical protein C4588_01040 [Candidatus Parcubacteria bacterium]|nr:MAG: hypothetical protein C4588_01040 [Candidatus Parcubacteria bacterium]